MPHGVQRSDGGPVDSLRIGQGVHRDRIVHVERANRCTAKRGQVGTHSESLAEVSSDRANVRPGRAAHREPDSREIHREYPDLVHGNAARGQFHPLAPAGSAVHRFTIDLLGGELRRHLLEGAREPHEHFRDAVGLEIGPGGAFAHDLALPIERIRRDTQSGNGLVALVETREVFG